MSWRLIDQLALTFEELEADATEDELRWNGPLPRRRLCADLRASAPGSMKKESQSPVGGTGLSE
jgi:hypothetical protein